jgi:hypothetical protein
MEAESGGQITLCFKDHLEVLALQSALSQLLGQVCTVTEGMTQSSFALETGANILSGTKAVQL